QSHRAFPCNRRAAEGLRTVEGLRRRPAARHVRRRHGGAVMALLILTVLAFVVGVGFVLGGYAGITKVPGMMRQRRLDARLSEVSQLPEDHREPGQAQALVKEELSGPLPGIDRMLTGTAKGSALARWIEQSGVKLTLMSVLLMACGCAAVAGLVVAMAVRGPWGLPVGAALGFGIPFLVLNVQRGKRMRTFEEAFPE